MDQLDPEVLILLEKPAFSSQIINHLFYFPCPKARSDKFFCKRPDSKYFRFLQVTCRLCHIFLFVPFLLFFTFFFKSQLGAVQKQIIGNIWTKSPWFVNPSQKIVFAIDPRSCSKKMTIQSSLYMAYILNTCVYVFTYTQKTQSIQQYLWGLKFFDLQIFIFIELIYFRVQCFTCQADNLPILTILIMYSLYK